jgi:spore maturation protein CgeB
MALRDVSNDAALRKNFVRSGLETIAKRHTCAHRVDELLHITERLRTPALESAA